METGAEDVESNTLVILEHSTLRNGAGLDKAAQRCNLRSHVGPLSLRLIGMSQKTTSLQSCSNLAIQHLDLMESHHFS